MRQQIVARTEAILLIALSLHVAKAQNLQVCEAQMTQPTVRWIYNYDGPGQYIDAANSITYGLDGNIYVTGFSHGCPAPQMDIVVASLTQTGIERWVYRYDGPGHGGDEAYSIIYGWDGYVYIAGRSQGIGTASDLTIIKLTTDGEEEWIYRYDGPGHATDDAYELIQGYDGNLYAVGKSKGVDTWYDIVAISVDNQGNERWVYRYSVPNVTQYDEGRCITCDYSGNIYIGGFGNFGSTYRDLVVISLSSAGIEQWVYTYHFGPMGTDEANDITFGLDGNIYVAGESYSTTTSVTDFIVISLTPAGVERWVYRYNGPGNSYDEANALVFGLDNNIYAAGYSTADKTTRDFTIISLTPDGAENWVYRKYTPNYDIANAIAYGMYDGNVYAAGSSAGVFSDFFVVSVNPAGGENWDYYYNGLGNHNDQANCITYGLDGKIYAAGYSNNLFYNAPCDLTVIGLFP